MRDEREDPDLDGLWNLTEFRARTAPRDADSDDDGLRDSLEDGTATACQPHGAAAGDEPRAARLGRGRHRDGSEDPDADGLTTLQELAAGRDPLDADSDGDGTRREDGATSSPAPTIPGAPDCSVLPGDNVWNVRVDDRPVAADSATLIASIGRDRRSTWTSAPTRATAFPFQVVDPATPRSGP